LAKTHRSLTFDEICEEAFGEIGLHPWEFYEYSLIDYLCKRKGYNRKRKDDYQQRLIASMLPYMKKEERIRIVSNAFREEGAKVISLRERYEAIKKRFQEAGELNFNNEQ
jgi:predicted nucleotide-binding protein (sugar kinase/HSP70/actin superfamily)